MNYLQDQLLTEMHRLSEDLFAAGWRTDLEFILWSAATSDGRHPRAADIPTDVAARVYDLAAQARGWWVHCNVVGKDWNACTVPGRDFVPTSAWQHMYDHKTLAEED